MKRIGTQVSLSDDERSRLLSDLNFWRDKAEEYFERRDRLENSFYCQWEGQHPSGLVLDTEDEAAWPFDGASDQRVRLADAAFQKLEALLCVALSSATIEVTTTGADSEKRSASILTLLHWMLDNLGSEGWGQIRAMIHYFLVDTPAVAAIAVDWRRNCSLRRRTARVGPAAYRRLDSCVNRGADSPWHENDVRNFLISPTFHRRNMV